jgi:hypothetical protein
MQGTSQDIDSHNTKYRSETGLRDIRTRVTEVVNENMAIL